jgi:dienelactone hydrolase
MLGDLPLYVVGPADAEHAVIVSYDIYGFHGGRIRNICDQIANNGYFVVLPDFFRGDCWSPERTATEPDAKMPWIKSVSSPTQVRDDLVSVIGMLKKMGVKRQGMAGFCFGGFAALIASQTGAFSCVAGIHASLKIYKFHGSTELAEVEKCACPMMLLQAENDLPNTKPGGEVEALLKAKPFGSECVYKEFSEMAHGWVPRGDLKNPAVKRDVGMAMEMIVSFMDKHVRAESSWAPKTKCPCAVCTCGPNCKCSPGGPGCDPCGSFQSTMKEAMN